MAAIAAVAIGAWGCSTAPETQGEQKEPAEAAEVEADDDGEVLMQAGRSAGQEPGQPQPFWGAIQHRADDGFEALEQAMWACLSEWGDSNEVRELALWAEKPEDGRHYQLAGWSVFPEPEEGEASDCGEQLAKDYVEAVGDGPFDDFDAYVASFLLRPDPSPACEEEDAHVVCSSLGMEIEESASGEVGDRCAEEAMDRLHREIIKHRDCWSGSHWHRRMSEYEEDPLELRALLFGEVRLEEGGGRLALEYNRPWVEEMATCVAEGIEGALEDVEAEVCQEPMRNRAITLWSGPAFTYMVDEDQE